jgi:sulfoxide reductase heme-binding subunit YedZ
LAALAPVAVLAIAVLQNGLGPDPIGTATRRTGRYALVILMASLIPTPLARWSGIKALVRARKPLGLYAFAYASLHLGIYVGWDYGFDLGFVIRAVLSSPFIWAGAASVLILSALAITSTRAWQRRLGPGWKALHRLVYLAATLAGLHYAMVFKELRLLPLLYLGALAVLLIVRLPAVQSIISRHR